MGGFGILVKFHQGESATNVATLSILNSMNVIYKMWGSLLCIVKLYIPIHVKIYLYIQQTDMYIPAGILVSICLLFIGHLILNKETLKTLGEEY